MTDPEQELARGRSDRASSTALSDISELTVRSRSPSPVPGYVVQPQTPKKSRAAALDLSSICKTPKRDRSPSPEQSSKKSKSTKGAEYPASPRTPKQSPRKNLDLDALLSPYSAPGTPIAWAVGQGGFGTLEALPKEIRQTIYAYAIGVDRPVTVRECCRPHTTRRERDTCSKHGLRAKPGADRFKVLQISKAIREEAEYVLFTQARLHINVRSSIYTYLNPNDSKSVRAFGTPTLNKRKMALWNAAANFRYVDIIYPGNCGKDGYSIDPPEFTTRILQIACSLIKSWQNASKANSGAKRKPISATVYLSTVFKEAVPFNYEDDDILEESFALVTDTYDEILARLSTFAATCQSDLMRLTAACGMHKELVRWKILADTELSEGNKGGAQALYALMMNCAKNGVAFEHQDESRDKEISMTLQQWCEYLAQTFD